MLIVYAADPTCFTVWTTQRGCTERSAARASQDATFLQERKIAFDRHRRNKKQLCEIANLDLAVLVDKSLNRLPPRFGYQQC